MSPINGFKGNIEYLTENEIGIRLRATQQNPSVLPAESLYAIEHDTMDTTFRSMYQGLYIYLSARKERRDLLLSQRPPRFDESLDSMISRSEDDFTRIALKQKPHRIISFLSDLREQAKLHVP